MDQPNKTKLTPVAILGIGIFLGLILYAPFAKANLFGDLWNNFISPNGSNKAVLTQTTQNNTPLYQSTDSYETAVINAVKKASPSVVSVTVSKTVSQQNCSSTNPFSDLPPDIQQFFGDQFPQFNTPCTNSGTTTQEVVGGGSGFIISPDGLILTNRHVVSDTAATYEITTNDGKKYPATILARDPLQDLAVLKINASGLTAIQLGDSGSLQLGQTAIAIGNALGEFSNTVSVGVVSGLNRTVQASGGGTTETIQGVIQTDAAINPGNSGGPLLNLQGQVIGINTAIVSSAQNIGFAIPINTAKRDISSVQSTGQIQTPFLGVRYQIVTPALKTSKGLPVDHGALVIASGGEPAVTADSPAAKAGIKAGDIILEIDGTKIDENNPLGTIVSQHNVGDNLTLTVQRGTSVFKVQATLAKRPQS